MKRKASDEPSSPVTAKRPKHEKSESDKESVIKPIPFPEKVCILAPTNTHMSAIDNTLTDIPLLSLPPPLLQRKTQ